MKDPVPGALPRVTPGRAGRWWRKARPPVIHGPFGDTTEAARLQAALNVRDDPVVRARVMDLLVKQLGDEQKALEWAKVAYPESFEDEKK